MKKIDELKLEVSELKQQNKLQSKLKNQDKDKRYVREIIDKDVERFYIENKNYIIEFLEDSIKKAMYINKKYIEYNLYYNSIIEDFFATLCKERTTKKDEYILPQGIIYLTKTGQNKFKSILLYKIIKELKNSNFLVSCVKNDTNKICIFWNKFDFFIYKISHAF